MTDPTTPKDIPGVSPIPPPADHPALATKTGWWQFHWDTAGGFFTATHTPSPTQSPAPTVRGATAWELEEQLGFPLPTTLHMALHELRRPNITRPGIPGPGPAPDRPVGTVTDPTAPMPFHGRPELRPPTTARLSIPGIDDKIRGPEPTLSYLPTLRTWQYDAFRVDVLGPPIRIGGAPAPADNGPAAAYRLSYQGRVILAGEDLVVGGNAHYAATDEGIRGLIYLLTTHHPDTLNLNTMQRSFVAEHGDDLSHLIAEPAVPYPPGTRVAVRDEQYLTRRGTIRFALGAPDEDDAAYGWRPDAADLPGHPWHHLPYAAVITPAIQTHTIIDGPDLGLDNWTPRRPLAYGAQVAFPDPATGQTRTATVIRTYLQPRALHYHLQPDDDPETRVAIRATDITPLRGTAWPTIEAVFDARNAAGIPLDPAETIVAGVGLQPASTAPTDYTPNVDQPAVHCVDDTVYIRDIDHGPLEAPLDKFVTALTREPHDLQHLLRDHSPPVHLTRGEPAITLAALVARLDPFPLDALQLAATRPEPETPAVLDHPPF